MRKCLNCEKQVPRLAWIDGKKRNLNNRKYCFECSPFGQHNTRKIHDPNSASTPVYDCRICHKTYQGGHRQSKGICSSCRVTESRRNKKTALIEYKGGKCVICNYNKCQQALQFHHKDPTQKEFALANSGTLDLEKLKAEVDKCLLVCSNCHSEIHAGFLEIDEYVSLQNEIRQTYIPETKPEVSYAPVIKISKRPDKEVLEKLVWEMSCVKIGEMLGVSDNAVNKWCKFYGIKKPGRGDWEKIKFGKLEVPKQ